MTQDFLKKSRKIYMDAVEKYKPDAVCAMISGGNDSAAAFFVAKEIGVKFDHIIHINTRTGIKETTDFVRSYYGNMGINFIEADAGSAYENYVLRKGFFGRGEKGHKYAYHVLKAGPLRKALSKHIRKRRRNITILLINGARGDDESKRRGRTKTSYTNEDPSQKKNVWVNIILDWTKEQRDTYLESRNITINPVTKKMCRSGECLCGTMQSQETRWEASALYPDWKRWIDDLEKKVKQTFPWGWGEEAPQYYTDWKSGQGDFFMPMCVGCEKTLKDED